MSAQVAMKPVETTEPELETITIDTFTRSFVEGLDPSKVREVDTDNGLSLFCYTNCNESDPEYIKACRGLVYDGDTLLLKAYSYTPEYVHTDEKLASIIDVKTSRFFDSHEGAVIRVFYHKKWYVSTHRRLNAFKSKWSSATSFGDMFKNALELYAESDATFTNRLADKAEPSESDTVLHRFLSTLDTKNQYMFLVRNSSDNRIVCTAPKNPTIYHIGTFIDGKLNLDDSVGIQTPTEYTFNSVDEALNNVHNIDIASTQGLCVFGSDGTQYKIVNEEYAYYYSIRGNEASIKFRYLQLRLDKAKVKDLRELYPEWEQMFDRYEDALYDIALFIKNSYVKRHIKKEYVTVPPEEYNVMKACHQWHIEDRDRHHISFQKVIEVLNEQEPTKLNKMIRRHINEERLKQKEEEEKIEAEKREQVKETYPEDGDGAWTQK
jgi:hypothetical protein